MTEEKRPGKLGRYLMGLGIGIQIGTGQGFFAQVLHFPFWYLPAVGIVGVGLMLLGFELCVLKNKEDDTLDVDH